MKKIKRFGVSLEDELLAGLDILVKKHKFPNRSQAIRFLVKNNLVEEAWQENKLVAGCIILIYDHHKRDLVNKLLDIQHDFSHLILASQHVHLGHHNCLETISLRGNAFELKKISDKLIAVKGIKHGKLVMTGI